MTAFDKVLLALYAVFTAIAALFVIFLAIAGNVPYYLQYFLTNSDQRLVTGVVATLLFLVSIKLLMATIPGKSPKIEQALIQDTHLGQVRITLDALENLIKKVA